MMETTIKATITEDCLCSRCGSEEIYITKKLVNHWKLASVNGDGRPEFEWDSTDDEDYGVCCCHNCNSVIETDGKEEFI